VGPVAVIEGVVLGPGAAQMDAVAYLGAVERFGTDRVVPAYLDRVHHPALNTGATMRMPAA
jgi:hypothetical protein